MWLTPAALSRIRELEAKLADSVTVAVYQRALERISELEARNEHQADMLLRRAQTYPMPKDAPAQATEPMRSVPDQTAIAQAEAIREEGRRTGAQKDEIDAAIKAQTGWTAEEIARAGVGGQG